MPRRLSVLPFRVRGALFTGLVQHVAAKKHKFALRRTPPLLIEDSTDSDASDTLDETEICVICEETLGEPRFIDGQTEQLHRLPCSHTFGSICIARWLLEDSPRRDCPLCRRAMVHPGCRHVVFPHDAATAPRSLATHEKLPEKCLRCRGEDAVGRRIANHLYQTEKQERALRGLDSHLPVFFLPRNDHIDVQKRIEALKRERADYQEKVWKDWLSKERRVRW